MARRFAEDLDIPLRRHTVQTREAAIEEVAAGRAHIGAAGLSTGVVLPPGVQFGPGYHRVREHLIYRGRGARPRSIREAARGQIEIAAGSPHQRTLEDLRLAHPDLVWVERADTDTEEIMTEVSRGTVQFTLASSTEFALNRAVHPELSAALDLAPERAISWVVATPGHDASLLGRVNAFFSAARTEGLIAAVLDRYYGARDEFDYLLSRNFMEHVQTRLPKYVDWFRQAGVQYDLDWRLLAAMGYQESKWDPSAVSHTGVRGLMQLTEGTATMMRAGDRRDPRASIFGGAKYLARLIKTVPERIPEPDHTWFAVAAYNVDTGTSRTPGSWRSAPARIRIAGRTSASFCHCCRRNGGTRGRVADTRGAGNLCATSTTCRRTSTSSRSRVPPVRASWMRAELSGGRRRTLGATRRTPLPGRRR